MVKYFRITLTTALLGAFAVPAFAQLPPTGAQANAAQSGEMVPATHDAAKAAPHAKATKASARKLHRAAPRHSVATHAMKTAPAPAN